MSRNESETRIRVTDNLSRHDDEANEREIERLARADRFSWWVRGRRAFVRSVLRRYRAGPGALVGDLGCGAGGMFEVLREFGTVVGLDISPLAATVCQGRGYAGIVIGSVDNLPIRAAALDLVGIMDVLEHIREDGRVLRECQRVLKLNGVMILTVPALPWLYGEHDRVLGHLRRYSRAELWQLVSDTGFQVKRITHFNALLLPLAIMRRLILGHRTRADHADPIVLPNPWNWLAYAIFKLEEFLVSHINLPIGLSLLCVARKDRQHRLPERAALLQT